MSRRKKKLLSRKLHKKETIFINRCVAFRYNRQATYKALQAYRLKKGLKTNKKSVYSKYSKALKFEHVKKARKTNREAQIRKGYSSKAIRQKFNDLINKAEQQKSLSKLMELPEKDS